MVKIYAPEFPSYLILIFELVFLLTLYYLSIRNKDMSKCLVILSTTAVVIYLLPIKPLVTSSVSFINVGQGDSCLIQKGSTAILIDTGGNLYHDLSNFFCDKKPCISVYSLKFRYSSIFYALLIFYIFCIFGKICLRKQYFYNSIQYMHLIEDLVFLYN